MIALAHHLKYIAKPMLYWLGLGLCWLARHLKYVAKFAVSGILIYWILRDTNLVDIASTIRSANKSLLLLAFSLNFVGYYISANRWRLLMKSQGINVPLTFLIKSYMVGTFFNNLLPSTIGGDIVRAYDSWRIGTSKAGAVAVIFVDRFLGILALMLIALGALLVSKELTANFPLLYLWMILGTVGLLLCVWLIFMPSRQVSAWVARMRLPLSAKLQVIADKIIDAFLAFQGERKTLFKALGLSLLLQTNVVIHYYLIARGLGLSISFHNFFLIIPLAIVIMMAPVSINAIGVRENVFAFFFSPFGVSSPQAIAFSWLAYGYVVLQGILGGVVYALRK